MAVIFVVIFIITKKKSSDVSGEKAEKNDTAKQKKNAKSKQTREKQQTGEQTQKEQESENVNAQLYLAALFNFKVINFLNS